jgi:hypothetical protein
VSALSGHNHAKARWLLLYIDQWGASPANAGPWYSPFSIKNIYYID